MVQISDQLSDQPVSDQNFKIGFRFGCLLFFDHLFSKNRLIQD